MLKMTRRKFGLSAGAAGATLAASALTPKAVFATGPGGGFDVTPMSNPNFVSSAAYDRAGRRKVELLKATGFNAIRTFHNPYSPAFFDGLGRQ